MNNKLIIVLLALFTVSVSAFSQIGKYKSYSLFGRSTLMNMEVQYAGVKVPFLLTFSGGGTYGISIKEDLNLRVGVTLTSFNTKHPIGSYEVCQEDPTTFLYCKPEIKTSQILLPIEAAFLLNSDYKQLTGFVVVGIMPVFSFVETTNMIKYNQRYEELSQEFNADNGFRFQDINAVVSYSVEAVLKGGLKAFIEPSAQVSLLFRKDNFVNPRYAFSLSTGLRYRFEKK